MRSVWYKWVRIVKVIISVQSSIILFVIFYLLILPMSIFLKLFSKNSLLGYEGTTKEGSYWVRRKKTKHDLIWARMQ